MGTKIHAVTNQDGLPLRYELTPGQAHDAPPCKQLLDKLQPGQHVLADKAYDADWIRDMIWEQGAIDVIPPKANRKLPAYFDAELYKERNRIEPSLAGSKPHSDASRPDTRKRHNFMAMNATVL